MEANHDIIKSSVSKTFWVWVGGCVCVCVCVCVGGGGDQNLVPRVLSYSVPVAPSLSRHGGRVGEDPGNEVGGSHILMAGQKC